MTSVIDSFILTRLTIAAGKAVATSAIVAAYVAYNAAPETTLVAPKPIEMTFEERRFALEERCEARLAQEAKDAKELEERRLVHPKEAEERRAAHEIGMNGTAKEKLEHERCLKNMDLEWKKEKAQIQIQVKKKDRIFCEKQDNMNRKMYIELARWNRHLDMRIHAMIRDEIDVATEDVPMLINNVVITKPAVDAADVAAIIANVMGKTNAVAELVRWLTGYTKERCWKLHPESQPKRWKGSGKKTGKGAASASKSSEDTGEKNLWSMLNSIQSDLSKLKGDKVTAVKIPDKNVNCVRDNEIYITKTFFDEGADFCGISSDIVEKMNWKKYVNDLGVMDVKYANGKTESVKNQTIRIIVFVDSVPGYTTDF
ncbi:hypothetical protein PHMEG_00015628 [Phytophthora megakarya]|uniref:Uncharacterized protein n=1 Tax=Phytophthora megakarya TaxID=4795 RepID=A0A225W0S5_9STRA|nr:hypothetical protein PHMEG_00015628 [Phytophthora megakarya]